MKTKLKFPVYGSSHFFYLHLWTEYRRRRIICIFRDRCIWGRWHRTQCHLRHSLSLICLKFGNKSSSTSRFFRLRKQLPPLCHQRLDTISNKEMRWRRDKTPVWMEFYRRKIWKNCNVIFIVNEISVLVKYYFFLLFFCSASEVVSLFRIVSVSKIFFFYKSCSATFTIHIMKRYIHTAGSIS